MTHETVKIADIIDDSTITVDLGDDAKDEVTQYWGKVTSVVFAIGEQPRICLSRAQGGELKEEWFPASRVKRTGNANA